MGKRKKLLLHRNDPDREPLVGHVKVTREDWLNVARDVLVSEGVGEVKVLTLGSLLEVSRSSFYWYFKSRKHLLEDLLEDWEARNTKTILMQCRLPATSITQATCNFFRCFIDPALFDRGLDFAVREWSRRDGSVRQRINAADAQRLLAVTEMFQRHGYSGSDAYVRARVLYFMQLGYHALEVYEPMSVRMGQLDGYIRSFTGQESDTDETEKFRALALSFEKGF